MIKNKLKKFNPYSRFSRLPAIIFTVLFAGVGSLIVYFSFAATPINVVQIDNGTCGNNSQLSSSPTTSWSQQPWFLLSGDGAGSTYNISIDNQLIGTFTANSSGNVCIDNASYASSGFSYPLTGTHILTGQELSPDPTIIAPFAFTINAINTARLAYGGVYSGTASGACSNNDQKGVNKTASWTNTPSFTIYGDGPSSSYNLYVDGSSIGTATADSSGNVCVSDSSALSDGAHVLTAQELAPNTSNSLVPFNFTVDTTPPVTAITNPNIYNDNISGPSNIAASATDAGGIATVEFLLNGSSVGSVTSTTGKGPFYYPWNSTTVPNGTYAATDIATDTAGNTTTSSPFSFTVNNTPQTKTTSISVTSPTNNSLVRGVVPITVSASDPSGISSIHVWPVNGSVSSVGFGGCASGNCTWDTTSSNYLYYPNGDYQLYAVAYNENGVGTQTAPLTLKVDNGDLNGDGAVNITDLSTWAYYNGTTGGATYSQGDTNGDGNVNSLDEAPIIANYGLVDK